MKNIFELKNKWKKNITYTKKYIDTLPKWAKKMIKDLWNLTCK